MKVKIVKAQLSHVKQIADHVRDADRLEMWALACLSPYGALLRSYETSDYSWTGLFDGKPVAMFGVNGASMISDVGRPWMIATDDIDRYPLAFMRECRKFLPRIRNNYARLENHVDVRNTRAIRWLKTMGFQFEAPAKYGVLRLPFQKFTMENN